MKRLLISIVIYYIKKDFGGDCPNYQKLCSSCQAKKCVEFLKEYRKLCTE